MNTEANSRTRGNIVRKLVPLLALACVLGCRSTGYQKSDAAAISLNQATAEAHAVTGDIETTLDRLGSLVNEPAADLKPQFEQFSVALDRLKESVAQTESTRKRTERRSADYFKAWDKQIASISDEKIREQSEARRAAVTNRFHEVNSRYQEVQTAAWPLINYFEDIRKALSVDLTVAGLESVKEIVRNADQNARKVQLSLAQLAAELKTSGNSLSSVALDSTPPSEGSTAEGATPVRSEETTTTAKSE